MSDQVSRKSLNYVQFIDIHLHKVLLYISLCYFVIILQLMTIYKYVWVITP